MKRVFLFLATNLAIVIMLSITMRLLGVEPYLNQNGLNLNSLLIFSLIFGFGGSFISLAISKWTAKKSVGAQVIETPRNAQEQWLVNTVARQAKEAGIGMPEVAIWDSPEVNAFATGMNKNNALVAVSSGLLHTMTQQEAEAVLGHEVAHIANGDMVTLTLIQGVVNTFVIFFARVIGYVVDKVLLKNEEGFGVGYFLATMVAEIVLGILASTIVMWFSRQREFRADVGGAYLTNTNSMIAALERLKTIQNPQLPERIAAFGISSGVPQGIRKLFTTHPPLDERIEALRKAT